METTEKSSIEQMAAAVDGLVKIDGELRKKGGHICRIENMAPDSYGVITTVKIAFTAKSRP